MELNLWIGWNGACSFRKKYFCLQLFTSTAPLKLSFSEVWPFLPFAVWMVMLTCVYLLHFKSAMHVRIPNIDTSQVSPLKFFVRWIKNQDDQVRNEAIFHCQNATSRSGVCTVTQSRCRDGSERTSFRKFSRATVSCLSHQLTSPRHALPLHTYTHTCPISPPI